MGSPTCQIKDGAGSWQPMAGGVDVTPGNTVTVGLVSVADVATWTLACITADETTDAAAITAALTIDSTLKQATFTAPAAGKALRFRSSVTSIGDGSVASATFGLYTLADNGIRVGALDETFEGDATYGWLARVNQLIRGGRVGGGIGLATEDDGFSILFSYSAAFVASQYYRKVFATREITGLVTETIYTINLATYGTGAFSVEARCLALRVHTGVTPHTPQFEVGMYQHHVFSFVRASTGGAQAIGTTEIATHYTVDDGGMYETEINEADFDITTDGDDVIVRGTGGTGITLLFSVELDIRKVG